MSTADKELPIPAQLLGMRVNILGHNVKVNLEAIGLTVVWDTNKIVAIEATAGLFNRTAGLCGTLDQHPENDFMSKNGAIHKVSDFDNAIDLIEYSITIIVCKL